MVPRLAVVWCPEWPVVAAGATPDQPLAVVHTNRVVARSRVAAAAGVRAGQRRREAQARCPALEVVAHDAERDVRAFHPVSEAVAALVPRLEVAEPGVLVFAARGPSRYFGGDAPLAARLRAVVGDVLGDRIGTAGSPAVGIADGRFAAGVAARCAGTGDGAGVLVVPSGESPGFLAPRPLSWLIEVGEAAPELVGLLHRLGFTCLGDVAALPAADVLARFGDAGVVARHLAAGRDERPPGAEDPPPGLVRTHVFDEPVHQLDTVVFAGRRLAEELVGDLAARGRVCTQLVVAAETEHGERTERSWTRSTGLSVAAMIERIRWQLDGWAATEAGSDAATAGVIQLRLEPCEVRADDGVQLGLWGGRSQADEWAQRAATRLVGLLGEDHVVVPAWQGGRHPGETYRWVQVASTDPADATRRVSPGATTDGRLGPPPPWPGRLPAPSPAIVHEPPLAVEVLDGSGHPVAVSGRGAPSAAPARLRVAGREEVVAAWAGPWIVEERWWDAVRHRRLARFQLLTAAGRAYVAVLERQQWWLAAEYV